MPDQHIALYWAAVPCLACMTDEKKKKKKAEDSKGTALNLIWSDMILFDHSVSNFFASETN